jgi:hypothetical protein
MAAKFESTRKENDLMIKIADRLANLSLEFKEKGAAYKTTDLLMDLDATNSNGCPLDFQKLLDAEDFDFIHDIFGICNNIDRRTGELTNCFLPQCAKPDVK